MNQRFRPHRALYHLWTMALLLLLAACAADATGTAPPPASPLQIILVSTDFASGQPRVSFALFDGPEAASDVTAVNLRALPLSDDQTAAAGDPVWSAPAVAYSDYELPFWVFDPEIDQPGFWGIVADITQDDGSTSQANFVIEIKPESQSPAIGETAPPSENRTLATEPDLTRLSSGNDPDPALYQMTVAEAVTSGKPTVVGFLTPGFCQTKWCAPVLESVDAVRTQTGDAANFIHIEVYDDFQTLTLVPEMAEWGLETEPWVFVLDASGSVTAKFSGPLSSRELQEALAPLVQ
jgi:hypothetical protein